MIGLNERFGDLTHIHVSEDCCRVDFLHPMRCISNAPWLGGMSEQVRGLLNLKVSKAAELDPVTGEPEPISQTFQRSFDSLAISTPYAGMMTAASMNSFRCRYLSVQNHNLLCGVTAGLANARRVGDSADETTIGQIHPPGTINLWLITDAPFNPAAQLEAFALLCEAKTAACYDKGISSEKSGQTATGTGTDVTLVASRQSKAAAIPYCGKHTLLGEKIGGCAYEAVADAIQACLDAD